MRGSPTLQFNIRLPRKVRASLTRAAAGRGLSSSAVAVQALLEWTRAQEHPGIDFRWTPAGRFPHATGTGLSVWEVQALWEAHGQRLEALLENYPHLTHVQVQAAVRYAEAYPRERPEGAFGTQPPFAREVRV